MTRRLRSRIVGTGSHLPERVVGNEEVTASLGIDSAQVTSLTGVRTRRWVNEKEATSDLTLAAAQRACQAAGVSPSSLEALVVSTTSPDTAFPSTACYLQRALGCKGVAAFDVAASCSGFLYGLSMADAMLRSGQVRRCLVAAGEVKSRFLDRDDAATAILFGDGAGAVVLAAEEGAHDPQPGIMGIRLYADGARHDLIQVPAGGSRTPSSRRTVESREHAIKMDGAPLFRIAVRRLEQAVRDILKEFGVAIEDIKQVILHQANGRILAKLEERLGLSEGRMYSVIERFGNTSSASLPIALDYAVREGRVAPGDVVLLGAFGGGLTWATALVRW